jgi:hypothetical protein
VPDAVTTEDIASVEVFASLGPAERERLAHAAADNDCRDMPAGG